MVRHHRFVAVSFVLAALACAPVVLHANTIYTYTGNPFTTIIDNASTSGTYTTSMNVSVALEFTAPLVANQPLGPVTPVHWSFSDGRRVLNDVNSNISSHNAVQTDGSGKIQTWDLQAILAGTDDFIETSNIPFPPVGIGDSATLGCLICGTADEASSTAPGSWAITTPEPNSLILTLLGLAGLAAQKRRRAAHQ